MKKFALIGEKLKHSYSPKIHSELSNYGYELKEIAPHELAVFMQNNSFDGFNVTIPYKREILKYLTKIDNFAKQTGAVNTVIKTNFGYEGYNTDVLGLNYLINSAGVVLKNKHVLILGSGGTAQTAKAVANLNNAKDIQIISRNGENNYNNIQKFCHAEVIINTTPVGMYPNTHQKLIDLSGFKNLTGVVDAVYNPLKTDLIFQAEELGIPRVSGLKMLVAQAKFASDLFLTNTMHDARCTMHDKIEKIYQKLHSEILNIVLIGMPSSGKTTVGKLLAKRLNKRFVDIDKEIELKTGLTISEIFNKSGEPAFRALENEVLEAVCKENNQIVATGGGSVTLPNAYRTMAQNGLIVHIERDLKKADTLNRPLLQNPSNLQKLYNERLPLYKKFAAAEVNNDGEINETVNKIESLIFNNFRLL
jgi:shikimate dehydrogenase